MINQRDLQPSTDTSAIPPSGSQNTTDIVGNGSARPLTSTDAWATETITPDTTPPDNRFEPQAVAPAPTADEPAKPAKANEEGRAPLFATDTAESFRSRWQEIQTSFVDEPRRAVEQADGLVAEVMQHLEKTFADERSGIETKGDQDKNVSTEDLRMALRHYRSFFDRLLSL